MDEGPEPDPRRVHVAAALAAALDQDHEVLDDEALAPEYLGRLELAGPRRDQVVEEEEALARACNRPSMRLPLPCSLTGMRGQTIGRPSSEARRRGEGQARRGDARYAVVGEALGRAGVGLAERARAAGSDTRRRRSM